MKKLLYMFCAVALGCCLGACKKTASSSSTTLVSISPTTSNLMEATSSSIPDGTTPLVTAKNFSFAVSSTAAKVGQQYVFKNSDTATHTFTFDDGSVDAGNVNAGSTATFTVNKAGTYKFHCKIHPSMTGSLAFS